MAVTRIRYDERYFGSAEQCLSEIASRLDRGWTVSGVDTLRGHFRAIFAWAEDRPREEATASRSSLGGRP